MSTARIAELEREVAELRGRLLGLARVLPVEYLPLLERSSADLELTGAIRMFDGWKETHELSASDVVTELHRAWACLR